MKNFMFPALLVVGSIAWTYYRPRGAETTTTPAPAVSAPESWTGVWMSGTSMLRLRQSGTRLDGEYSPEATFIPLKGWCDGSTAAFSARVAGTLWNFRLMREGTVARLTGKRDAAGYIDRLRPLLVITPRSKTEREQERKEGLERLAKEREELRQVVDFGVFERID